MRKLRFFYIMMISFNCFAYECYIEHEDVHALSVKNSSLIHVESWVNKPGNMVISLKLPKQIGGEKISTTNIGRKCTEEGCLEYDFNLSPFYDEGEYHVFVFQGGVALFKDAYLTVSYAQKGTCKPYMKYKISEFLNEKK